MKSITPGWYSIAGAAAYTGFSIMSIRRAIALDKFPIREVHLAGKKHSKPNIRIARSDLDAWIELPKETK